MRGDTFTFTVTPEEGGSRLDSCLGRFKEFGSRSRAAALIADGAVTVDGEVRPKSHLVSEGQVIVVRLPRQEVTALVAESIPVDVPFEDEWLMVVDKPAGMPVHPSRGHSRGTLVNALLARGLAGGEEFRPGVVHRLDKDTSGLLVVAKSAEVHQRLTASIRRHEVDRRYLALVHGVLSVDSGTIEAPVGRDPVRRKSMAVGGVAARQALTHFRVVERLGVYTLVEAQLETGRTHQIRVHFLAINHPIAGDPLYARRDVLGVGRQFLHSHRLTVPHPMTGETLSVESRLPEDLRHVLGRLRDSLLA